MMVARMSTDWSGPVTARLFFAGMLLIPALVFAGPTISLNGLFKGRAVLVINGNTHLLKVGDTSPEGVTLVASDGKQAVVEADGKRMTLSLSRQIGSDYSAPRSTEVRIPRGENGHYFVGGSINGRRVEFMVDTGATSIAMNIHEAERLGINFRRGVPQAVSTAGGMVNSFRVQLDKITIGGITLRRINAVVVLGDYPQEVLLGNSFLSRVEMNEQQGVLVLQSK